MDDEANVSFNGKVRGSPNFESFALLPNWSAKLSSFIWNQFWSNSMRKADPPRLTVSNIFLYCTVVVTRNTPTQRGVKAIPREFDLLIHITTRQARHAVR